MNQHELILNSHNKVQPNHCMPQTIQKS